MEFHGYTLDPFQENAIKAIESGASVVVSAPTGSGKTLIAEYLIEKFLRLNKRIIYTSPIKALSNQKFRDFRSNYREKVGILTGDVVINENAQVLIMTTEIFRNMLFNDISALNGVSYVIFDEIHYINDIERGVIWEESIIFSPKNMRFLALSATIPNADSFAKWIQTIKGHEVKVVKAFRRPVPLQQYVYNEKNGLITLEEFKKTLKYQHFREKRHNFKPHPFSFYKDLIKLLIQKKFLPTLFFIFSREATYNFAYEAYRSFSFTTPEEREDIERVFNEVISDEGVKNIESVKRMKRMVLEGIGVHNAGLLPILKELVEVLFTRRLLKLLFVTETFALGVNMPAKTVIFHSLEKYDGIQFRTLMSREFFQMAGRAGRRGIDEFGNVITVIPKVFNKKAFLGITDEKLEPLESQFKLSYNTILNLIKKYPPDEIENIINLSFHQFQTIYQTKMLKKELNTLKIEVKKHSDNFECGSWKNLKGYLKSKNDLNYLKSYIKGLTQRIKKTFNKRSRKRLILEREWVMKNYDELLQKHNTLKCTNCKYRGKCKNAYHKIREDLKKISKLEREINTYRRIDQIEVFHKKKHLLEVMGYVRDNTLLPRGEIGALVYGYELIITELLFDGFFEIASETLINMVLSAIIYERPRRSQLPRFKHPNQEWRIHIRRAKKVANRIRSTENNLLGERLSPSITTEIMPITEMWCNNNDFEDILDSYPLEEGDIIRIFRGVIDLLRQLIRITREDKGLNNKFKRCIGLLDHDIVSLSYYLSDE